MEYGYSYSLPLGILWIYADDKGITGISLREKTEVEKQETPLIRQAAEQLAEYMEGARRSFDVPLNLKGTPFQKSVWAALCDIPYGETRSYKQIAEAVGNPKGCRAVGMANNRNPVMIIVPCHRVIGMNGKLVGYAGGLDVKERLLAMEKVRACR